MANSAGDGCSFPGCRTMPRRGTSNRVPGGRSGWPGPIVRWSVRQQRLTQPDLFGSHRPVIRWPAGVGFTLLFTPSSSREGNHAECEGRGSGVHAVRSPPAVGERRDSDGDVSLDGSSRDGNLRRHDRGRARRRTCRCRGSSATPIWSGSTRARAPAGSSPPGRTAPTSTSDIRRSANPNGSTETNPGTVVVDVSDPTHPTPTTWLTASAMIDPWESVKVNPARQLLGGGQRPLNAASPADGFSVYDISADCKHPAPQVRRPSAGQLRSHRSVGAGREDLLHHPAPQRAEHRRGERGRSDRAVRHRRGHLHVLQQHRPRRWRPRAPVPAAPAVARHLEFSKDGNTAYITMFGTGATAAGNGFAVLDVSDFQQRRRQPGVPGGQPHHLGRREHRRAECAANQDRGKPYIVMADEGGGGAAGCASGQVGQRVPPPDRHLGPDAPDRRSRRSGSASPTRPTARTSRPRPSPRVDQLPDGGVTLTPGFFFAHSCHYCNVDDVDDARIIACNCFAAGLRFWDIHDITSIKEMAYYKPPAQGTKALPGSQYANSNTPPTFVRMYDWATSKPSFPKDRGADAGDIWTTSQDNGFQVISLYSKVTVAPSSISGGHEQGDDSRRDRRRRGKDCRRELVGAADDRRDGDERRSLHRDQLPGPTRSSPPASSTRPRAARRRSRLQTGGGCSTTAGPFTGLLPIVALLGWLLWRRRTSPVP